MPNKKINHSISFSPLSKQPGLVLLKPFLLASALFPMLLAGCASTSSVSTNAQDAIAGDEDDYRASEHTLVRTLETPPDLFAPSQSSDGFQRVLDETKANEDYQFIPTYRAKSVAVKNNLVERWLEIKTGDTQKVWDGVTEYLQTIGMKIKESRKDIGLIETEYLARAEIVPLDAMGGLTKVLNSWRPEVAEGAFDRFVVQIESDKAEGMVRVYFKHHMIFNGDAIKGSTEDGAGAGNWKVKPYDPRMESEALYEAMIFFGAKEEEAQQQVRTSEQTIKLEDGKEEFSALILSATMEASWSYLKSMIYRADWSVDEMNAVRHRMVLNVPTHIRKERSFWSSIAFWQDQTDSPEHIPEKVVLVLTATEENGQLKTILKPFALEGDRPLTAANRKYIFESLGLLAN